LEERRKELKKTAIVMDSTGYLSPDIISDLEITVVPLNIIIGDETFPETALSNETMFAKLEKISGISTTSQPSVGMFLNTYEKLIEQGYEEIISLHLSQRISGTFRSAEMAKELTSSKNSIFVIDSGSAALGLGLLAWSAAELAQSNAPADKIIEQLEHLKAVTKLYFVVDTLEYLHRGGRIGGAAALFGTLLQIKPILHFNENGEIDVFDKVRSRSRALQRVLNELAQIKDDGRKYRISILHVQALQEALQLEEHMRSMYNGHEIRIFECGPVIATHVGPGTLGISFQPIIGG